MKALRLASLVIVLILLTTLAGAASASTPLTPDANPCTTGMAYDQACDVNQDGEIDIIDVQLTADKWNQSGTFNPSDNNHDHLGQTWTGNNNPLKIEGSFASFPDHVALAGTNAAINSIGVRGVANASGSVGIWGQSDANTGVFGLSTDGAGVWGQSTNGPAIRAMSTISHAVSVQSAGWDGVNVYSAGDDGVQVVSAGEMGVAVNWAGEDGLKVYYSVQDGVDVAGDTLGGWFNGGIQLFNGGCTGCLLVTFGVNSSDQPLASGDVVSLAGLRESGVDSVPMLMEVQRATGNGAVVGVVQGWAELLTEESPRPSEIGKRLVSREGPAKPGQFVTIAYSGLTQVKATGPISQGRKLAVGDNGLARSLRTVEVDGIELAEDTSTIGIALESHDAGDGLIWALVNVQ